MSDNTALQQESEYNARILMLDNFKMLIFVLILGLFSAGVLVVLENYTGPMVEANNKLRLQQGVLESLGIEADETNVNQVFEQRITRVEKEGTVFYQTEDGRLAFEFVGEGLWAEIRGIIAFKSDLEALEGLAIIEQAETPGLGGRITEEEFLQQFRGLVYQPQIEILRPGNQAEAENEVDGLTGATMTSEAMETMLNVNIERALQRLEVK